MSMLVTLRILVAGVLDVDESSLLRFSELADDGVLPFMRPLVLEGVCVGVGRLTRGCFTARPWLWLWMSLSISFALRFRVRSELADSGFTGDPERTLWTG